VLDHETGWNNDNKIKTAMIGVAKRMILYCFFTNV
jgi:hypothetical protein